MYVSLRKMQILESKLFGFQKERLSISAMSVKILLSLLKMFVWLKIWNKTCLVLVNCVIKGI